MRNVSRLFIASLLTLTVAAPLCLAGCGDSDNTEQDLAAPDLSAHDGAQHQPDLSQNHDGGQSD